MPFSKFHQHNASDIAKILLTSVVPYIFLLVSAYFLVEYSYWWVLALVIPTHIFHARMFVVMHDCGHYSFCKSRILNNLIGHLNAFFFLTPFFVWRELHNKHHRFQGNLDQRNQSLDVWTLTTEEYNSATIIKRAAYRFYRHPLFLFSIAPLVFFVIIFRVPFERFSRKALLNILLLDAVLGLLFFQVPKVFLVLAPSMVLGFAMASFLFYIQHQFENTIWLRETEFKNSLIAEHGSSYYKLPTVLNWVYGNIGYHHLHHLDVKIPMYNLPHAQKQYGGQQSAVTLRDTFKCLKLRLWDEKNRKLVGFN